MKSSTLVETDASTDIHSMEGALKDKAVRETVRGAGAGHLIGKVLRVIWVRQGVFHTKKRVKD